MTNDLLAGLIVGGIVGAGSVFAWFWWYLSRGPKR